MAVADPLRVPVRVCVNPTDLTLAFPYGGTDLGLVRDVLVSVESQPYEVTASEWGPEVVEVVEGGEVWRVSFAVRGATPEAVAQVFMQVAADSTGWPVVQHPAATRRPGRPRSQDAVRLLLAPLDPEAGPATLFRAAVPVRAARLDLSFRLRDELTYALAFVAVRDDNGAAVWQGPLASAVLDTTPEPGPGEGFGEDFGESYGEA